MSSTEDILAVLVPLRSGDRQGIYAIEHDADLHIIVLDITIKIFVITLNRYIKI